MERRRRSVWPPGRGTELSPHFDDLDGVGGQQWHLQLDIASSVKKTRRRPLNWSRSVMLFTVFELGYIGDWHLRALALARVGGQINNGNVRFRPRSARAVEHVPFSAHAEHG